MLQQEECHLPMPFHFPSGTEPSPMLLQGKWAFLLRFFLSCISTGNKQTNKHTQKRNYLLHSINSCKNLCWGMLESVTAATCPQVFPSFMYLSICLEDVHWEAEHRGREYDLKYLLPCSGDCVILCSHCASGLHLWRRVLILLTARLGTALLYSQMGE